MPSYSRQAEAHAHVGYERAQWQLIAEHRHLVYVSPDATHLVYSYVPRTRRLVDKYVARRQQHQHQQAGLLQPHPIAIKA